MKFIISCCICFWKAETSMDAALRTLPFLIASEIVLVAAGNSVATFIFFGRTTCVLLPATFSTRTTTAGCCVPRLLLPTPLMGRAEPGYFCLLSGSRSWASQRSSYVAASLAS
ncbi:uncharacterized protein LOC108045768 [Drosophila rhopaloa]|uniref:Uncharacterized protein LOC108045768 isoform X2 n=1 Tax=Drosophila rhopaloa TaxID=1041015 RepID=A0A6P4F5P5_DRORH|nr:uncharacterized protein LOC108045768 [Drosophila rhopaloa]